MHRGERGSIVTRMTPLRSITALAAAALLVGCQTTPPPETAAPEPQPDPSALTVMAEVALQKGDCKAASDEYSRAAEGGAAELARRASEVALACHDLPDAWKAAERWHTVAPGDRNAQLVYGTVALMLYRIPPAHQALTPLVAGTGRNPERDALSLVQLLSDDPAIGAIPTHAALGQSIDAHTASPLVIGAFGALALEAYDFHAAELRVQQLLERDGQS